MQTRLRKTTEADLDFVLATEAHPDNQTFVSGWPRAQHQRSLSDPDILHLIVESAADGRAIGYVILAGLAQPHHSLELRRMVIAEKGYGYGRAALQQLKELAFDQLCAHRLWLDVKDFNRRAQRLYETEGFQVEGTLRECLQVGDEFKSLVLMSMLRREYAPLAASAGI